MIQRSVAVVIHRMAGEMQHTAGKIHILILEADNTVLPISRGKGSKNREFCARKPTGVKIWKMEKIL